MSSSDKTPTRFSPAKADAARFVDLNRRIVACTRCPRLRGHCENMATVKRAAFRDEVYHGLPVPNFGSGAAARLLVVGLAPAAHGANRTGRMFTGDRSGDFLYRAMHEVGFANQPTGTHEGDGLKLIDTVITAAGHCAPPDNKPLPEELAACAPFLDETFDMLRRLRVVVCLGRIALDAMLRLYQRRGWITKLAGHAFGHGVEHRIEEVNGRTPPVLLCSFHPSQQNTFTGRLTPAMLRDVFERAKVILSRGA